jgi:hypothetical protein
MVYKVITMYQPLCNQLELLISFGMLSSGVRVSEMKHSLRKWLDLNQCVWSSIDFKLLLLGSPRGSAMYSAHLTSLSLTMLLYAVRGYIIPLFHTLMVYILFILYIYFI